MDYKGLYFVHNFCIIFVKFSTFSTVLTVYSDSEPSQIYIACLIRTTIHFLCSCVQPSPINSPQLVISQITTPPPPTTTPVYSPLPYPFQFTSHHHELASTPLQCWGFGMESLCFGGKRNRWQDMGVKRVYRD